jgi:peptidoglycan/LPS O-acetylase OafA/YrhL
MRYVSLDALRGLAALTVVTHHCVLAGLIRVPPGFWTAATRYTPLHLFVSGRPPVILFFVLSGFALAVSLEKAPIDYGRFALRRMCRIYLPYSAMILISALISWSAPPLLLSPTSITGDPWIGQTWNAPADAALIANHLLMPLAGVDLTLDRSAWSLVHEARISLVFPALFLMASRSRSITCAAALLLSVAGWHWAGCAGADCLPYNGVGTASSFGATAYFIAFFVAGILLAQLRDRAALVLPTLPPLAVVGLWAVAIYGMIIPFKYNVTPDVPVGMAAMLLIVLTLGTPRVQSWLACPALLWLGRVSFSLYLVHIVVLAALIRWVGGGGRPILLVAVLAGSLAAADLLYRAVERPCLRLGQFVAAWPRRTSPVPIA